MIKDYSSLFLYTKIYFKSDKEIHKDYNGKYTLDSIPKISNNTIYDRPRPDKSNWVLL